MTTSSCSGRVSVFVPAPAPSPSPSLTPLPLAVRAGGEGGAVKGRGRRGGDGGDGGGDGEGKEGQGGRGQGGRGRGRAKEKGNPGGKGRGGRWLFVSHEALAVPVSEDGGEVLTRMFGLSRGSRGGGKRREEGANGGGAAAGKGGVGEGGGGGKGEGGGGGTDRFVRFAFEPMVCKEIYPLISPCFPCKHATHITPPSSHNFSYNRQSPHEQKNTPDPFPPHIMLPSHAEIDKSNLDPPHSNRLPLPRRPCP